MLGSSAISSGSDAARRFVAGQGNIADPQQLVAGPKRDVFVEPVRRRKDQIPDKRRAVARPVKLPIKLFP